MHGIVDRMGIEPFLLVAIVGIMFLVQAARAVAERLQDRLELSEATRLGVRSLTARHHMLPDRDQGGWLSGRNGLSVQVWFDAFPARQVRRILAVHTGFVPRNQPAHLDWFAPSILIVVRLAHPLTGTLRLCRREATRQRGVHLDNPVLGHLLRMHTDDAEGMRRRLLDPALQEPLLEMMGTHPLSVVTHDTVALWCSQACDDPEPLVELAVEVAAALQATSEATAIHHG